MRRLDWYIAWRYLFSRERKGLVSAITLISVLGVAIGVASLIVTLGVMDGANKLLYGRMAGLFPHLRIMSPTREPYQLDERLLARLRQDPEVVAAEPIIYKMGVIQSRAGVEAQKQIVPIIGIDELKGGTSVYTLPSLKPGQTLTIPKGEVMLGEPLARKINAKAGDSILVIASSGRLRSALTPSFNTSRMTVKDTFATGLYNFDSTVAFMSKADMRRIFNVPEGAVDYVHVKLKDPARAAMVAGRLNLPPHQYLVYTWEQESGDFFAAIQLQKFGLFIILLLIVLVAAFNIIGTLILMVMEKTREVGILRAIGAGRGLTARVFLLEGVLIGLAGTLVGLVIGLVLCAAIPLIRLDMPAKVYNFDHLPVSVQPLSVALIVLSSMLICTLASLLPALSAARLNPVEALRYD